MNDFGKNILEDVVNKHPDSYPSVKLLENFHHFIGLFNALDGKFNHGGVVIYLMETLIDIIEKC